MKCLRGAPTSRIQLLGVRRRFSSSWEEHHSRDPENAQTKLLPFPLAHADTAALSNWKGITYNLAPKTVPPVKS